MHGIPNCVPEYYRSMWEDEDIKYEKELQREEEYKKNRELLDNAWASGLCILAEMNCASECFDCTNRTHCIQRDYEDDIGLFVCLNKGFCVHQKEE